MRSITITPKNKTALNQLNSFLEKMQDSFIREEIAENEKYYPELERKINQATKRRAEGKAVKLDTSSFDTFLKSIRSDE